MVADGKMKENVYTLKSRGQGFRAHSTAFTVSVSFYPCKTLYVVFSNLLSKWHYFTSKPVLLSSELTTVAYPVVSSMEPGPHLEPFWGPSAGCQEFLFGRETLSGFSNN